MLSLDDLFVYLNSGQPLVLEQPVEVSEEAYDYFLNILPPIYIRGGFAVCEAITGNIHSHYYKSGDKYFHQYLELRRG